ncbi:hypothetical protein VNO78_03447 [Psophocarpus tetragonolobus]|uniref:Uncharacterized protein n=1 Tax=Psophocarpus tetragonolobus TaxID=3891 RepID=A0AAN9T0E8_PSOTE
MKLISGCIWYPLILTIARPVYTYISPSMYVCMKSLDMDSITTNKWLSIILVFSFHFVLGFSDNSPAFIDATKTEHGIGRSTSTIVVIVLFVLVLFSLLSFILFKLWRKKKREEQYARLLKLFEEDDELELELGLRD